MPVLLSLAVAAGVKSTVPVGPVELYMKVKRALELAAKVVMSGLTLIKLRPAPPTKVVTLSELTLATAAPVLLTVTVNVTLLPAGMGTGGGTVVWAGGSGGPWFSGGT